MKRAIIIVIDSLGAGAMPDATKYNDIMECNTLSNVANCCGGLKLPFMQKMGLGNIQDICGVSPITAPIASYGIMEELSEGKDTTTGHWEITGLVLDKPFRTYAEKFPDFLIEEFIKRTGCGEILGNCPASGTAIIADLGDEHVKTGYPIVYTSADSVFQIACHIDVVPLEKLYKWCEIARKLIDENAAEHNIGRVIARPFKGESGNYTRISASRKDYSVPPHKSTILNLIEKAGGSVFGIGKIEDIFVKSGVTEAVHTGNNREGLEETIKALSKPYSLIFTNLVDTDMLFGHRNDALGYGKAIEEIDVYLEKILPLISKEDILFITADHGCDPTVPGTDHTREKVPVLMYSPSLQPKNLGSRETFADIAATIGNWLGIEYTGPGRSMI